MKVNPLMFREYDIRGRVDEDLTVEVAEAIGKAYGTMVKRAGGKKVVSGRDGRLSGPKLQEALIRGILSTGINVVNIGVTPTPVMYFSLFTLEGIDGGIQVTGSHNPPEFNGFKICLGKETLYGPKIQKIRKLIEKEDFETGTGNLEEYDILPSYLKYLKENIKVSRSLKVVLDCGNGVTALTAPYAFRDQGCEVTSLYCEVDGTFPNHFPDPTVEENIKDLREKVLEIGADFGVGYDGDGDRIGVVDDKGKILWGDQLLIIFAREILKERPGATIIGEVKCSQVMYDEIARLGGKPIMWKTGHSLIKGKMKEEKAVLAGEMSGHLFFADRFFGFDDAVYASLRLAEIVAKSDVPLSEMLKDLPKMVSTPEIRVECPDDKKFEIVRRLTEKLKAEGLNVIDIDGARVIFEDGWGLVRASNTQPVLVLRFEAKDEKRLEEIRRFIEERLEQVKQEV
ncbi:phosphoglucomutase/phosphomannomutase alpha/beta/alpha domain I [Thermodesulfatator indicus DSM 15286]|uniref:Phosphoglucomutase/phosphomannomutase alpha/beta/alpha domain I n=1 Tax=Thermodesulfatator indicus (strain DSM 15286 / JCM 11887 / CIR29812) TaxID=667014 RepID=F8ADQ5_THEID|nr:phosphomannomutase/phosphoglucomutase [Thermodesulfatator indicus]AEH46013.1 phosphoglucomutase/phosphomannomutase alpha/beta/alpha domain I [Thermodesulfatator indicus DSM 15286]